MKSDCFPNSLNRHKNRCTINKSRHKNKAHAHTGPTAHVRWTPTGSNGSPRSRGQTTRSRSSVVFLCSRANAWMVPKFHAAMHSHHATLLINKIENSAQILLNFPALLHIRCFTTHGSTLPLTLQEARAVISLKPSEPLFLVFLSLA